jgi:hypothetical protein
MPSSGVIVYCRVSRVTGDKETYQSAVTPDNGII